MNLWPRAVLLTTAAVALAGCAGSGPQPSAERAVVHPSGRVRAEIAAARAKDAQLFAIFPNLPGRRRCAIPSGAGLVGTKLLGTCLTRVWYPNTHGHGEARVVFREDWGRGRFSSWALWEELPSLKVLVTKLHGSVSPQMRLRATETERRDPLANLGLAGA